MSEHDDWDAGRLRRVDRPHPLSPDADDRVRRAMLASFDSASTEEDDGDATQLRVIESPTVADDGRIEDRSLEIDLRVDRLDIDGEASPGTRRPRGRWPFLAAVAVLLLVVGIAVVVVSSDDSTELTEADQAELVASFCAEVANDRIAEIEDFHAGPSGERVSRALRSIELLSQGHADLGDALAGELGAAVRLEGDEFIQRAADIRRLGGGSAASETPDAIRLLATDVANAIDALPGSEGCRTAALRGP